MQQTIPSSANRLALPLEIEPISEHGFCRFRELIEHRAGINLGKSKKALLVGRLLRRLRELGLTSFDQYYEVVMENEAEFVEMLDCICTNETRFFREPRQFEFLEANIFPAWREGRARGLRASRTHFWSAGCSTGEEPFSIAMALASSLSAEEGWSHEIVATDISSRALRSAQAATWDVQRAADIPGSHLQRYMSKGTASNAGRMRASDELRAMIRFDRVNLKTANYGAMGQFDAVFCRNVLIYFDSNLRSHVIAGMISCLRPGGYLFLGHAEALLSQNRFLKAVIPSVFQKVAGSHA